MCSGFDGICTAVLSSQRIHMQYYVLLCGVEFNILVMNNVALCFLVHGCSRVGKSVLACVLAN